MNRRAIRIAGGVFSGSLALCCLVSATAVLLGRMVIRQVAPRDSTQTAKLAAEIAEYDLPPGYSEQSAMNFGLTQTVVIAPDTRNKPVIMLMQFAAGGADPDVIRKQMEQSLRQSNSQPGLETKVVEEKEVTIKGETVILTVRESSDSLGNVLFRQMSGVFKGKEGLVMLMITGQPDHWDEEEIERFIESIR